MHRQVWGARVAPLRRSRSHDFTGDKLAVMDLGECATYGICGDVCRFEAIIPGNDAYRVDALTCEGCAACHFQCPNEAIHLEEQRAGQWFRSDTRFGPLFHAPGDSSATAMGLLDFLSSDGADRQPAWFALDGEQDEIMRGQDGFWLGTAGCCRLDHHQKRFLAIVRSGNTQGWQPRGEKWSH